MTPDPIPQMDGDVFMEAFEEIYRPIAMRRLTEALRRLGDRIGAPLEDRGDGWPKCPMCHKDELFSLALEPSPATIRGCYRCGWTPHTVGELVSGRVWYLIADIAFLRGGQ